jgi:glycosyltransferase involved in cell wall biosynthesis
MTSLKLLIIGTTDNKGGAASVGWNIGETLRYRGYSVKYIVGFKFSDSPHVHELKTPWLTRFLEHYLPYNFTGLYRHFSSFLLANDIDRGASEEILNHPWYKEADIVHCQNLHGSYFKLDTLVRMSKEKKVFWTLHDMWAISGNCVYTDDPTVWKSGARAKVSIMEYPPMLWNNAKYLWSKKKQIYQNSPSLSVIVPSRWLGDKVKESILKDKNLSVIYNGINSEVFKPGDKAKLRLKYNIQRDKRIVTFVAQGGGYDPRKGWNYIEKLAKAYENDPNILFMCIGGAKKGQIGNILYVPNISDKKILAEYYGLSDVFLFTSLAENCPLVVLESMSCGLPVISFDVGGVPELVEHKVNGYIAKYKDGIDLSSGLNWILSLPITELNKISNSNRAEVVSKYSIDKMVDVYENLFKNSI